MRKLSILQRIVDMWNDLSPETVTANTINTFKKHTDEYLKVETKGELMPASNWLPAPTSSTAAVAQKWIFQGNPCNLAAILDLEVWSARPPGPFSGPTSDETAAMSRKADTNRLSLSHLMPWTMAAARTFTRVL